MALSMMKASSGLEVFKESVLLPGEELLTSLNIVAIKGMLTSASSPMKVGRGVVLLTRLVIDEKETHRIHFYIDENNSSFDAKQTYLKSKRADKDGQFIDEVQTQVIHAKHEAKGTIRTCFVEKNFVHIHSEMEEVYILLHPILLVFYDLVAV